MHVGYLGVGKMGSPRVTRVTAITPQLLYRVAYGFLTSSTTPGWTLAWRISSMARLTNCR
jgi:hypothetical protein